jgi:hypothetical protein
LYIHVFQKIIFSNEFNLFWTTTLFLHQQLALRLGPGNSKGGSITVPLTSCLSGLEWSVLQIKTKLVSSNAADSKPVKQEVIGILIVPTLVFPAGTYEYESSCLTSKTCRGQTRQVILTRRR